MMSLRAQRWGILTEEEEARLHGIRWLECGRDLGAVSGSLRVLEASLRPHADLREWAPMPCSCGVACRNS